MLVWGRWASAIEHALLKSYSMYVLGGWRKCRSVGLELEPGYVELEAGQDTSWAHLGPILELYPSLAAPSRAVLKSSRSQFMLSLSLVDTSRLSCFSLTVSQLGYIHLDLCSTPTT